MFEAPVVPSSRTQSRSLLDDGSTIDILAVWTPRCAVDDTSLSNMCSVVSLAITESNQGYENSNILKAIESIIYERILHFHVQSITLATISGSKQLPFLS